MPKYRQKPVEVEAVRWFEMGDHPAVQQRITPIQENFCDICFETLGSHGRVNTLVSYHIICPGDYIITGEQEYYPCKPDVFAATYNLVEDGE